MQINWTNQYGQRVAQLTPDEQERIQKEVWQAKKEALRQKRLNPRARLSRPFRQFLRFLTGAFPFVAIALYFLAKSDAAAESVYFLIGIYLALSVVLTLLLGGISFLVYSLIFQPWIFTRIPENRLPPLNDQNNPNDQNGFNSFNVSDGPIDMSWVDDMNTWIDNTINNSINGNASSNASSNANGQRLHEPINQTWLNNLFKGAKSARTQTCYWSNIPNDPNNPNNRNTPNNQNNQSNPNLR